MSESGIRSAEISQRGARCSLIENFGIDGLYGYRSIALSSDYAATILIARNGTGKTTLLGALDAFLHMQFARLRNLEFKRIYCKLRPIEKEIVLTHEDVIEFLEVPVDGELARLASRASIEPKALFNFLIEEWSPAILNNTDYMENKVFSSILSSNNYSFQESEVLCDRIKKSLYERHPNVQRIFEALSDTLTDYDIVYLPTYRRVELALTEETRGAAHRRRRSPKFNVAAGSLFTGNIQFGLSDISERLAEINQKLIIESNNGYREISANIINELIDGSYEQELESGKDIPTEDDLKLFFGRLQQSRNMGRYPPVSTPNLDKIYSEDAVPGSSAKFLNYFLNKLATVIRASKEVESPVDAFIASCNKYLLSGEPSTLLADGDISGLRFGSSGKSLRLDRKNLKVHVESVPEGRKISLDALSSGEKQMISLFAKLFLYPGNKIVLIDEPELSLSIDWQMQILVDVLNAPLCEQIIAITHSPFVFDNELEPFAKSLEVINDAQNIVLGNEDVVND